MSHEYSSLDLSQKLKNAPVDGWEHLNKLSDFSRLSWNSGSEKDRQKASFMSLKQRLTHDQNKTSSTPDFSFQTSHTQVVFIAQLPQWKSMLIRLEIALIQLY